MQYSEIDDTYRLGSGRRFYANGGIIGLGPNEGANCCEGYDGGLHTEDWTQDEREELANYMMNLWLEWKKKPHA